MANQDRIHRGTIEEFVSDWFWVEPDSGAAGGVATSAARRHGLGDIPSNVFVERDDAGDGRNARDATADMTVTRDRDEITVVNVNTTEGFYCRIRAR